MFLRELIRGHGIKVAVEKLGCIGEKSTLCADNEHAIITIWAASSDDNLCLSLQPISTEFIMINLLSNLSNLLEERTIFSN